MDRDGADFYRVLQQITKKLNGKPVAIQLPIDAEDEFKGLVDLIEMKAYAWDEESLGAKFTEIGIPEDMTEMVQEYRMKLIEGAAEESEELLEKFIEDHNSITKQEIIDALRRATLENRITPVLCGSSLHNIGVQKLIDAVVQFLPSPMDVWIQVAD